MAEYRMIARNGVMRLTRRRVPGDATPDFAALDPDHAASESS